jgi:hypothetical protein
MVMTTPINTTLPTTSLIWNDNFLWNDTCREQGTTPYFSSATTPAHKVLTTKKTQQPQQWQQQCQYNNE